jgi:oligogalacturonide lyase
VIVQVALDGSGSKVVFEEDYWLGHVNTSPRMPHLLTYCHEGPWNLVENRIWGLDLQTGNTWQIRPNAPDEAIGHEYWMVDGEHIGYHGRTPDGPVYGAIRYDNTDRVEAPFTYGSTHFHSLMLDLIVGDGSRTDPYLLLWRFEEGQFVGPKVLAWHRGSFHTQRVHVHPCFSPDGKQVAYTADPQGYGQVFLVDVPDFDALPDRSSL